VKPSSGNASSVVNADMKVLPLFPVTTVGSWPRPLVLLRAQKLWREGRIEEAEFQKAADDSVREVVRRQEEAGVDIVTDGEQRRDNFVSFVATRLEGTRLMTLLEMLELIENKAGFERLLQTLDVPAYSISNATCVGRIARRAPLAADEVRFLKSVTSKPIKVALPGPYLLTRSMWVKEASGAAYSSKEELGSDVVRVLRQEIVELLQLGVSFIQLDEPVLTELVFTQGQTRTFMCAALSARKDPAEELEFAVHLLCDVFEGFNGTRFGLHVCRGNWSRNESTLLSGSYDALAWTLNRIPVRQLVLEYSTERAGAYMRFTPPELGLGVINPRTDTVDAPDEIIRRVERALALYPAEAIFLNPDCGFSTFSNRPMASENIASAKLCSLVAAAHKLRESHGTANGR
jgi:5-methyltetrahydropteroyltriglutamate--homocysteine methyltransferase